MNNNYYGYYSSPLGLIEIRTNEEAVLGIHFVQEKRHQAVHQPFILKEACLQLEAYFKGTRQVFTLKYELHGTPFRKQAWEALTQIPYGQTISYKEQAIRIGNEKAVRAVGGANSKNELSILVPCHRVIGSNQSLTGYAGGLDKKQWLLAHEQSISNKHKGESHHVKNKTL